MFLFTNQVEEKNLQKIEGSEIKERDSSNEEEKGLKVIGMYLADKVIQAHVMVNQVQRGLWSRNGSSIKNFISFLSCMPDGSEIIDADFALMQIASSFYYRHHSHNSQINFEEEEDHFIRLIFERFNMEDVQNSVKEQGTKEKANEVKWAEVEACLWFIMRVINDRNIIGCNVTDDAFNRVFRRGIIHALFVAPQTHSALIQGVLTTIQQKQAESILAVLDETILPQVANFIPTAGKFEVKPEIWKEYDPYYEFYTKSERDAAAVRWEQEQARQQGKSATTYSSKSLTIQTCEPQIRESLEFARRGIEGLLSSKELERKCIKFILDPTISNPALILSLHLLLLRFNLILKNQEINKNNNNKVVVVVEEEEEEELLIEGLVKCWEEETKFLELKDLILKIVNSVKSILQFQLQLEGQGEGEAGGEGEEGGGGEEKKNKKNDLIEKIEGFLVKCEKQKAEQEDAEKEAKFQEMKKEKTTKYP